MLDKIVNNIVENLNQTYSNGSKFASIFEGKMARIIGEVKIASPSYDYSKQLSASDLIDVYGNDSEIYAISYLINNEFFAGDITRILLARKYGKPSLFKEFVTSKRQIDGAFYYGYDAILLIARLLDNDTIVDFIKYCEQKNIFSIVEIDNEEDIERVIPLVSGCALRGIAVNSRNLGSMIVDVEKHFLYARKYHEQLKECKVFAFSGILSKLDAKNYVGLYDGILIGSSFVKNYLQSNNSIDG